MATRQTSGTGYQIMLDRLFGGKEPPAAHATGTIDSFMQLGQVFLTREDRALVADMYEYAESQSADLKYVDEIAYLFESIRQVREMTWFWRLDYNEEHPHESLGNLPPAIYRAKLENSNLLVSHIRGS